MSKKEVKTHNELETVEHALTASEAFIEKNQKKILTGVSVVVLIVLGALSFHNFYLNPREIAAQNEMYKSQVFFAADSFRVALEGDGSQTIGFKGVASDYSITSSGNLASAYAGICYFKLGQYENAIEYLSKFNGKDDYFSASVEGLKGDCYVELNQTDKAINSFEKAADFKNDILSPVYLKKAAIVYESLSKPEEAEKNYTTIKEKYPKSPEAMDIEKYLARVQK